MRCLLPLVVLAGVTHAAQTYVVCAGVDRYDNAGISPLQFAVADVRAVADAFRAARVPERNVAVLANDETEPLKRPSRSAILAALQSARDRAVEGDTLVFMFSGHGMQVGENTYLLTVDADRELLEDTALPMRLVEAKLRGFQGSHVLFIIDACRNDPNAGRANADATLDEGFAKGVRPVCIVSGGRAPDAALLLACDVGQRAYEWPTEGHGAFTSFLLKGLTGEAKGADGLVSAKGLADYTVREVTAWAARSRHQQTPRFDNPGDGDYALLRPPGRIEEIALNATLKVTTNPPGATVTVDGRPVGLTPLAVLVPLEGGKPREVRVEVALDEYVGRAANVGLVAGATQEWSNVRLERLPAPTAQPPGLPAGWPAYLAKWSAQMPPMQYRVRDKDGMPQVLIPAGEFLMGSPDGQGFRDEHPQKQVYVSAFWMDLHEVTVAQFERFCTATGRQMEGLIGPLEPQLGAVKFCSTGPVQDRRPVVNVDWNDADAYAKWAGGSLPTEAQWEKAARGGLEGMAYPWGNDFDAAKANNGGGTKPVGTYAPNGCGLFDMAGNVWEWCADWSDQGWYAKMPSRDPVNNTQSGTRVLRGGSWNDKSYYLKVSGRQRFGPSSRYEYVGFRCCEAP